MSENSDTQKEILVELKEIKKIHSQISNALTLFTIDEIESRLNHIFDSQEKLLVYKLSDGTTTTKELGKIIGKSHATIANWWKTWEKDFQIVETKGYNNPYKARYSIIELAIIFGKKDKRGK